MNKIRFVDFFAGIGGFRSGLEMTKSSENEYECVLSCEIDNKARQTYSALYMPEGNIEPEEVKAVLDGTCDKKHEVFYDDAVKFSELPGQDMKKLISSGINDLESEETYELFCGGFPCQPFSRSGKRRAFEDENKGNLFFAICEIVRKTNPKQILLENVKGLLTVGENKIVSDENSFGAGHRKYEVDKGKSFLDILYLLSKLGYDVEWQVLNSNRLLPHKRERVYIHCYHSGKVEQKIFPLVLSGENGKHKKDYIEFANELNASKFDSFVNNDLDKYRITVNDDKPGLNDFETDETYTFGSSTPFLNWGMTFRNKDNETIVVTKKLDDSFLENGHKLSTILEKSPEMIKGNELRHIDVIRQIWSKSAKVVSTGNKMGKMNFPDSVDKPSRTLTATRTLGREIMIVGYYIEKGEVKYIKPIDDKTQLLFLTEEDFNNVDNQSLKEKMVKQAGLNVDKNGSCKITVSVTDQYSEDKELPYYIGEPNERAGNELRFRTLTEREYWKLQGFLKDDGYFYHEMASGIDYEELVKKIGSDNLKKQAGNAVTVNVISELAQRLKF